MTDATGNPATTGDAAPPDDVRVVVYTRGGCHLCEVAMAVVADVCAPRRVGWREIDIDGEPELAARYTDQVPVTFVDGRQHDFWRVDPGRLAAALDQ